MIYEKMSTYISFILSSISSSLCLKFNIMYCKYDTIVTNSIYFKNTSFKYLYFKTNESSIVARKLACS